MELVRLAKLTAKEVRGGSISQVLIKTMILRIFLLIAFGLKNMDIYFRKVEIVYKIFECVL